MNSYKGYVDIPSINETVFIREVYFCGGTLINRDTILTAAHCVSETIEFTYENIDYMTTFTPSEFNPTFESMFKVYVGINDINGLLTFNNPENKSNEGQRVNISKIISVLHAFLFVMIN